MFEPKKDPKRIFAYVRQKLSGSSRPVIRALGNSFGVTVTYKYKIVNAMNRQFQSVFTESGTAFPVLERRSHNTCSDELVEACLTEESMEKRLSQLDGSKAMGNDGINAYVLKQAAPGFSRPIRMLLALSFRTYTIPSAWR